MTSDPARTPTPGPAHAPAREAFVWTWLPGATEPVVAGRVEVEDSGVAVFNYGRSYLERPDAIALYLPELPLRRGALEPIEGLTIAGALADAGPDAWGRRVIENRIFGAAPVATHPELDVLTYLLRSGSDRIGALDFQTSATDFVARGTGIASLEQLLRAAEHVEHGDPLAPAVDEALLHGSSIGGARPKALLDAADRKLIAKFASTTDSYSVVKGEYVAMELARRCGLVVAPVELTSVLGKDVLLVERFDRVRTPDGDWSRRAMVSGLTMLGLHEMLGRYASYADLARVIRERFTAPRATLRELFARIVFNILVGNNDDHARNHAAFWDGTALTLTPLYDVSPLPRAGGETRQAMAIGPDGFQMSQVAGCVDAAATYLLAPDEAREIVDHQRAVIEREWDDVCDAAGLSTVDRRLLWNTAVLNPDALEGDDD
jgi:serine/threonine-protein kinase HipA